MPDRERALHEWIGGAALRAAVVTAAFAPVALLLALASPSAALSAAGGTLAFAFAAFLLERRDASWPGVMARATAGGVIGALLAQVLVICLEHAGAPLMALGELSGLLARPVRLLEPVLLAAVLTPGWALPLFVRARTTSIPAQAVSGLILALPLAILVEIAGPSSLHRLGALPLVALAFSGTLAGLGLGLVERGLAARVDPSSPAPRARGVASFIATWALLGLLGAAVVIPNLVGHRCGCGSGAAGAIGSLKAISTAQALFAQGDKDRDGAPDFAGSLIELSDPRSGSLIDATLGGGVKGNYIFRLVRDESAPDAVWCATADPIDTELADRRFWIDQSGKILYARVSATPPAPLDPRAGPPSGWTALGK